MCSIGTLVSPSLCFPAVMCCLAVDPKAMGPRDMVWNRPHCEPDSVLPSEWIVSQVPVTAVESCLTERVSEHRNEVHSEASLANPAWLLVPRSSVPPPHVHTVFTLLSMSSLLMVQEILLCFTTNLSFQSCVSSSSGHCRLSRCRTGRNLGLCLQREGRGEPVSQRGSSVHISQVCRGFSNPGLLEVGGK